MAIQRADSRGRKLAILIIGITSILGACAIFVVENSKQAIAAWLEANMEWLIDHAEVVFLATLLVVSPILAAALYLFSYARQIVNHRRLPPPGFPLVRDTKIIDGSPAIWRARVIQGLAALLFCVASALPFAMWYIFRALA